MKELEAIRDLAPKWRKYAEPQTGTRTTGERCADELEALLPALEKAFADLELELQKRVCIGTRSESLTSQVMRLEAEIAALRGPMGCGHPKACWKDGELRFSEIAWDYEESLGTCIACEHKRLAVAAALAAQADSPKEKP